MNSYGLFVLAYIGYSIAMVIYLIKSFGKINIPRKLSIVILVLAVTAHTFGLLYRWKEAGHAPFANMYESLVFMSWVVGLGFLCVEIFQPMPGLGSIVMPITWLILGYSINVVPVSLIFGALDSLTSGVGGPGGWFPPPTREAAPLMPALNSYWLEIHVITIFIGYGAFALSFGTGILYLWKYKRLSLTAENTQPVIAGGSGKSNGTLSLDVLDQQTYWLTAIGFILLGAGIIFGAVWANETWGSYWSWDPKETWSLITWFVYAAFLHTRLVQKWRGPKTAWLAVIGFITVLICYYGVNVILPRFTDGGLHSYGSPE